MTYDQADVNYGLTDRESSAVEALDMASVGLGDRAFALRGLIHRVREGLIGPWPVSGAQVEPMPQPMGLLPITTARLNESTRVLAEAIGDLNAIARELGLETATP